MTWLLAAAALLVVALASWHWQLSQKLAHIPGPRIAAWTNFWLVYAQLTGKIHIILHDLVTERGQSTYFAARSLTPHRAH